MTDQNSQFFAILTAVGEAKQANADALGVAWTFAQMGVGDANGTEPIPNRTQTRLINERRRAPLNQVKVDPANASVIVAEQVIPPDVGGWWIREIGLYDVDGDLVAVANCAPSFKPLLNQGTGKTQIVRLNIIVTSTANVQLKIDPAVVLATREFVDTRIAEELDKLDGKNSVRAATTVPITLSGTKMLDGVAVQVGDRVLVKDQIQGKDNGIYLVAAGAWTRARDADSNADVTPGLTVTVELGEKQADTLWKLVTDAPLVLGTTPLLFQNVTTGYSGTSPRNTGGAIVPAEAGKMIYYYGTEAGQTLNLPSAAALPVGATINVQNVSNVPITMAKAGTDTIQIGGVGGLIDTLMLYPGSELEFTCVSNYEWFAQGTGALHRMNGLPTLPVGTSNGQLTNAEFVQQELAAERGSLSPLMDGVPAPGVSVKKSREDHRHPTDTSRAPLNSPALTGVPTAPTPALAVNNSQIATTAFVAAAVAALVNAAPGALDTLNELATALGNDPNFAATMNYYLSLKAPLANPALTGTPTAPMAIQFDDSNQLATTAFVRRAGNQFGGVSAYTASAALPPSVAGRLTYFYGSALNQALTLPAASALPVGAKVQIQNLSPNNVSINRAGTDNVQIGGSVLPTVVIPGGAEAIFTCIGPSDWFVQGSAVLDKMTHFASLKSINGWERSPSGVIRQWGFAVNGDQSTGTSIILPTTYLNANLCTVACAYNSTGDIDHAYVGDIFPNYFNLFTQSMVSNGGPWANNTVAARWVSYGY
ncbi:hypothetical protein [Pseudomonas sp. 28 E 9]|uniref:phage tail protein n=1 Tax=Pseudomonas sp. 28 E 9 TaxID=1844098 RepID=UPI000812B644|nr:phage tail protein [Pseudomonas sp. 28 E 9]CRL97441.1 hypothetical protein [Pseudomonas sp. 28 E 9]CRM07114.1 hypothetical protein [Pseudomonas sp. 28 E 9]